MNLDLHRPRITTEICIIGGSIAGNYLAFLLGKRNIPCVVVEEHLELGKPFQCAGIVSRKIRKIESFPKDLILNQVHKAEIVAPNGEFVIMKGREAPLVIDRVNFDAFFGHEAQKMGAQYLLGEKYETHWALRSGETLIQTNKHLIHAKIVVGADGPFSKVAARLGIFNKTIPATQVRSKGTYNQDHAAMYFSPEWNELFGYIVPEGSNGIYRIGLATKRHPKEALEKFLSIIKNPPNNAIDYQGGVIPFGFPGRIAFENTVLLGDAARMVKATTGGGIVMLMSAAKVLRDALVQAIEMKDYSKQFLRKAYERPIKLGVGAQLKVHYFIRLLVMRLTKFDFNHFFKLYQTTNLADIIGKYADMDFPLLVFRRLLVNRYFIRFLVHIAFRNWSLIPQYLHDIAL